MMPFTSAFMSMNSLFPLGGKRPKSKRGAHEKTSIQAGTAQEYTEVIKTNNRLKAKYRDAVNTGTSVESATILSTQACARAIAFHIHELSRLDSFIPNMGIMTTLLELDLKYLKELSVRMCNGDKKAGELKAAQLIEDACEQFNAERRRAKEAIQQSKSRRPFLFRYFS